MLEYRLADIVEKYRFRGVFVNIPPKRIAVLFHESDNEKTANIYVISPLFQIWKEDGHEVVLLFGTENYVPADILIMHVDLSIVPDRFFKFASQYPIVVNGLVRDIRKSTFSRLLVRPGDGYSGKVIVKSDLNAGGKPEQRRLYGPHNNQFVARTLDYKIYDHADEVPPQLFASNQVVVEKFIPEVKDGLYCIRNYHFFGGHQFAVCMKSENPIVNGKTRYEIESIKPDPQIREIRRQLRFDYGKFDYVMHEGEAILLDINKTMGMSGKANGLSKTDIFQRVKRYRAEGLYTFFDRPAANGSVVPVTLTMTGAAPSVMPMFG